MLLSLAIVGCVASIPDAGTARWEPLADGVEQTTLVLDPHPTLGDGLLHAVRIDPERARLEFGLASEHGGKERTAGTWADQQHFVATINAGMFNTDHSSNVGLLKNGSHANNPKWNEKYQSVLAFGPLKKGLPQAVFVDLDQPGAKEQVESYRSAVQNLRLLKGGAENVWQPTAKKWSEAAIALDTKGRVLFLFARSPMTMHAFNERLKQLPLDLTRAMHVEGGPEASLSIRAKGKSQDLCGSYESLFKDDDRNAEQWVIPNVLGVVAR